jgi:hypothetical protein
MARASTNIAINDHFTCHAGFLPVSSAVVEAMSLLTESKGSYAETLSQMSL